MKDKVDDILRQYPYIGDDIQRLQTDLNKYIVLQKDARNPLKAQNIDGMPKGSGISDQTCDAVERLIDLYQKEIDTIAAEINELLERKKWLDKAFIRLTENERRVVYLYYTRRTSINKLAYELKCSRRTIYKVMDEAKTKIRSII